MKRTIRFRGKLRNGGGWMRNNLHGFNANCVIADTIGQLSDVRDKNGKDLYEGDIVQDIDTGFYGEVVFDKGWYIKWRCPIGDYTNGKSGDGVEWEFCGDLDGEIEIVGNIHDNPELLKQGV